MSDSDGDWRATNGWAGLMSRWLASGGRAISLKGLQSTWRRVQRGKQLSTSTVNVRWSLQENKLLERLVSDAAITWNDARGWGGLESAWIRNGGRPVNADTLRKRWRHLAGGAAEFVVEVANGSAVNELSVDHTIEMNVGRNQRVQPMAMTVRRQELGTVLAQTGREHVWTDRCWTRALRRRVMVSRALTPLHVRLAWTLQLQVCASPHASLFCSLDDAGWTVVKTLMRTRGCSRLHARTLIGRVQLSITERDRLKTVLYPSAAGRAGNAQRAAGEGVLPCVGANCGGRWVYARQGEVPRYVDSHTVAEWMGIRAAYPGTVALSSRAMTSEQDQRRWQAIGDAIPLTIALAAWIGATGLVQDGLDTDITYASLYSGAYDMFLGAVKWLGRHHWPQSRVEAIFAAELSGARRRTLAGLSRYRHIYTSAEAAVCAEESRLDVLSWCAPCPPVSRRGLTGGIRNWSTVHACTRASKGKAKMRFNSKRGHNGWRKPM